MRATGAEPACRCSLKARTLAFFLLRLASCCSLCSYGLMNSFLLRVSSSLNFVQDIQPTTFNEGLPHGYRASSSLSSVRPLAGVAPGPTHARCGDDRGGRIAPPARVLSRTAGATARTHATPRDGGLGRSRRDLRRFLARRSTVSPPRARASRTHAPGRASPSLRARRRRLARGTWGAGNGGSRTHA